MQDKDSTAKWQRYSATFLLYRNITWIKLLGNQLTCGLYYKEKVELTDWLRLPTKCNQAVYIYKCDRQNDKEWLDCNCLETGFLQPGDLCTCLVIGNGHTEVEGVALSISGIPVCHRRYMKAVSKWQIFHKSQGGRFPICILLWLSFKKTDSQSLTHTEDDSLSLINYWYWLCTQYWLISKAETCVSAAGVMDILVYLYISLLIFSVLNIFGIPNTAHTYYAMLIMTAM